MSEVININSKLMNDFNTRHFQEIFSVFYGLNYQVLADKTNISAKRIKDITDGLKPSYLEISKFNNAFYVETSFWTHGTIPKVVDIRDSSYAIHNKIW